MTQSIDEIAANMREAALQAAGWQASFVGTIIPVSLQPSSVLTILNDRDRLKQERDEALSNMAEAQLAEQAMSQRVAELGQALERIAELTPTRANAKTAHDLHLTIKAIALSAADKQ